MGKPQEIIALETGKNFTTTAIKETGKNIKNTFVDNISDNLSTDKKIALKTTNSILNATL